MPPVSRVTPLGGGGTTAGAGMFNRACVDSGVTGADTGGGTTWGVPKDEDREAADSTVGAGGTTAVFKLGALN
jgi:hypothetical protein